MGTSCRQYLDEFKRKALELLLSSGQPLRQISGKLGIPLNGCGLAQYDRRRPGGIAAAPQHVGGDPARGRGPRVQNH